MSLEAAIVDLGINGEGALQQEYWPDNNNGTSSEPSWWESTNWFSVNKTKDSHSSNRAVVDNNVLAGHQDDNMAVECNYMNECDVVSSNSQTNRVDSSHGTPGMASVFNRFLTSRPRFPEARTKDGAANTSTGGEKRIKKKQKLVDFCEFEGFQHYCDEARKQIAEYVILPLKFPHLFKAIGCSPTQGILLSGAPGSGKTRLISALKEKLSMYVQSIQCSDLLTAVDASPDKEDLLSLAFRAAIKNAPAIVFLDEVDVIAGARQAHETATLTRVRGLLQNQLDELADTKAQVCVIGATNCPGKLEPSLLRKGRFARSINLVNLDETARLQALLSLTSGMRLHADVVLKQLVEKTQGFVVADLDQLCAEAGLRCIREHLEATGMGEDSDSISFSSSSTSSTKKPDVASTAASAAAVDNEEKAEALAIASRHFDRALHTLRPASLRDVVRPAFVQWGDIGGQEEIRQNLLELVEGPITHPQLFQKFGLAASSGLLLYGPPGCGKTLMARAVATECKANFISASAPDLLSSYVGQSEKQVRELFAKARMAAPCILFFDEVDALTASRGGGRGNDPTANRVLTQLLCEMDARADNDKATGNKGGVFVIGATNRPASIDPAMLRPGRFDQLVYVALPDLKARVSILRALLRKSPLASDIKAEDFAYLSDLATRTEGYSGADLAAVCNVARRQAINLQVERELKANTASSKGLNKKSDEEEERGGKEEEVLTRQQFETALLSLLPSVRSEDVVKYDYFTQVLSQQPSSGGSAKLTGQSTVGMSPLQISRLQHQQAQQQQQGAPSSSSSSSADSSGMDAQAIVKSLLAPGKGDVEIRMQELVMVMNGKLTEQLRETEALREKLRLSEMMNSQLREQLTQTPNSAMMGSGGKAK